MINKHSPAWTRFYHTPPKYKSIDQCRSHGYDHRAYNWSPQVDPRWSEDQKKAYWEGYERV